MEHETVVVKTARLRAARLRAVRFTPCEYSDLAANIYGQCDYRIDNPEDVSVLNTNTVDPDGDINGAYEFGDIDDEFDGMGMTVVSPATTRLVDEFLLGYRVGIDEPFPVW